MKGLPTVLTYALLTFLWGSILVVYLRHRRDARRRDPLVAMLLSVLALDALKSVVESLYFGLVWGTQYGFFSDRLAALSDPGPLTAIKWINVAVAALVLARLIRIWIPTRLAEREAERAKLETLGREAGESEERFRVAFQTIPDAMSIGRLADGVNVSVNEVYCRLSGWSEREVVGATSVQLNLWVNPAQRASLFAALHKDGFARDVETEFRRKDGTTFNALVNSRCFTVGQTAYFLTVTRDVTESRRAARAQAATYRIAEAAGTSATLKELLGTVHQIVGELMPAPNFYIALHEPGTQKLEFPYFVDEHDQPPQTPHMLGKGLTEHVLRTGQPLLINGEAEFQALCRTGQVEDLGAPSISWVGVPLRTHERTVGVLAAQIYQGTARYDQRDTELLQFVSTQVAHAIEKIQAEQALRQSEHRFRALIENTSDGVCLLGGDGTIVYSSPSMEQMLGFAPSEPLGNLVRLLHPEDRSAVLAKVDQALAHPSVPVLAQGRARRKDGSTAVFEGVFTNLLAQPAVRGIVLNLRDLTERKQMEARLMMADRMVSVGTLAAGVAHEINNPLAYVIANLDHVSARVAGSADQETAEALREAQSGAERVRIIVRDLKTFSRGDEAKSGPIELQRVLDASANMAWNEIRQRARLIKDYAVELPLVLGNESRLGQVFLNLLINAAQAIPEGAPDQNQVRICTRREEERVIVEVSDSGAGIAREHLPRLFDPFFTTKPIGVGTGLGLFICQNIISALGGEITVRSAPGKGTTMIVSLPAAKAEALDDADLAPAPERAGGRLLIIDDEPMLCAALRRRLPEHEVATETSPLAALSRIRRGEQFDLILCDLMMRELSGMAFHEILERESPSVTRKIVFMTGGAFTPVARAFLDRVKNPRLEKPIDLHNVRALLASQIRVG